MQHASAMSRPLLLELDGGSWLANLKRVLWFVLGGTRGGPLRIRILARLRDRPYNTNQLATDLGVDYKTVQHHVRVLMKNRLIDRQGSGQYGAVFFLSPDMEQSLEAFDEIADQLNHGASS